MPGQTDVPRGRLVTRLIAFYAILAVITVAVVVLVISKGGNEKARPRSPAATTRPSPNACIGPVPQPAGGRTAAADRARQAAATGRSFNVLQSGPVRQHHQQSEHARRDSCGCSRTTLAGGGHRLTGTVDCVSGGIASSSTRWRSPGREGHDRRHARRRSVRRRLQARPPAPGAAAPRTPSGIDGHVRAVAAPRRASAARFDPARERSELLAPSARQGRSAPLTYSTKTAPCSAMSRAPRAGHARLTATANDLQLQNVKRDPARGGHAGAVAAPPAAKPVLTTPSGLGAGGREVHRHQAAQ